MFKCKMCGSDSAIGETLARVVVATRRKEYPSFQRADGTHDRGGTGIEIARETSGHESCVRTLQAELLAAAPPMLAFADTVMYTTDVASGSVPFNGVV
jgi:hypothetical protein